MDSCLSLLVVSCRTKITLLCSLHSLKEREGLELEANGHGNNIKKSNSVVFIPAVVGLKKLQRESPELSFIWGKVRTAALEMAPQIALRPQTAPKVSIYVILVQRACMQSSTYFSRRFLLVS